MDDSELGDQIGAALKAKGINECPVCKAGSDMFAIPEPVHHALIRNVTKEGQNVDGFFVMQVVVPWFCRNCGFIALHSPRYLGLPGYE